MSIRNKRLFHRDTVGVLDQNGKFIHKCNICGLDFAVSGKKFRHLCTEGTYCKEEDSEVPKCNFDEFRDGVYRCTNIGCSIVTTSTKINELNSHRCQSGAVISMFTKSGISVPCKHLGSKTSNLVENCSHCGFVDWQITYIECNKFTKCIPISLPNHPELNSCDSCGSYEKGDKEYMSYEFR